MDAVEVARRLADSPDGAKRLAEVIVDQVLARPVAEFIELDALAALVPSVLTRDNAARVVDEHVLPGLDRVRKRLAADNETVGAFVPPDAREEILAMASNPRGPRFAWLKGAVGPEALSGIVGPIVLEVLMQFVQSLPIVGPARAGVPGAGGGAGARASSGLLGRLGRGTERLVDVGRTVAGGLGADLQNMVREAARDYSRSATSSVQLAIAKHLRSPQGVKALEQVAQQITDHILNTPVEGILGDLDRLPLNRAVGVAPNIIAFSTSRDTVRELIAAELSAYVATLDGRSAAELLELYGILPPVRDWALRRVEAEAKQLLTSDPFKDWLASTLQDP